jgi:8-oxo-dGTP pyrophosphatase MutT (NUDIX family)
MVCPYEVKVSGNAGRLHREPWTKPAAGIEELLELMASEEATPSAGRAKWPTLDQVSAGGVAFRQDDAGVEVALIATGQPSRWQLPKGIVDPGESPEDTALREVREEAGITTEMVAPIHIIEYWYVGSRGKQRVRFHKFVHFFLLAYCTGEVSEHDHEVSEARWVSIDEAANLLAFKGERDVVARAAAMIEELSG